MALPAKNGCCTHRCAVARRHCTLGVFALGWMPSSPLWTGGGRDPHAENPLPLPSPIPKQGVFQAPLGPSLSFPFLSFSSNEKSVRTSYSSSFFFSSFARSVGLSNHESICIEKPSQQRGRGEKKEKEEEGVKCQQKRNTPITTTAATISYTCVKLCFTHSCKKPN